MPFLRIYLPDQGETIYELSGDRVTIGRRPENAIQLIDRSVSAHHAEFIFVDGHYRLHDLESTNFTFVEGAAVTDYHLLAPSRIAFGTVQCEFDPTVSIDSRLSPEQLENEILFLQGQNADLEAKIAAQQRRIDILNSARLVTGRTETTPSAAASDTLRAVTGERDDLRHQNTGLKLELEKLREELSVTARERDAARRGAELLKAERVAMERDLQDFRNDRAKRSTARIELPIHAPGPAPSLFAAPATVLAPSTAAAAPMNGVSVAAFHGCASASAAMSHASFAGTYPAKAEAGTTQRIVVLQPEWQAVLSLLAPTRELLAHLGRDETDSDALVKLAGLSQQLAEAVVSGRKHPAGRLIAGMDALLQDRFSYSLPPFPSTIQTLDRAASLLARMLDPRLLDRAEAFPAPSVLVIDGDPDLLASLLDTLALVPFEVAGSADASEGLALAAAKTWDLILLDDHLAGVNGDVLATQLRETATCHDTPIIFLVDAGDPDGAQPIRLPDGSDFVTKPFHTGELIVKGQTWGLQSQFGML